ncbi:MAG: sulfite exporter TauE/SafE family protein [Bdellovibrio bacteriovorus]
MNTAYLTAFVIGLLSALHCIGMCGGILGALSFSLPADIRAQPRRLLGFLFAINLGRIASYAAAGALFGWLGGALLAGEARVWLYDVLRVLAALVMVGIGLYIGGWFPRFAAVERLGEPLWRLLEPIGRRLLPVHTPVQAILYGAVWGWLPCGLVYSMLIGSPAQAGAAGGALYMALFGAGTLPVLLTGGLLAGRLYRLGQDRRFQAVAGLLVIVLGLSTLHFQGYNVTP